VHFLEEFFIGHVEKEVFHGRLIAGGSLFSSIERHVALPPSVQRWRRPALECIRQQAGPVVIRG